MNEKFEKKKSEENEYIKIATSTYLLTSEHRLQ